MTWEELESEFKSLVEKIHYTPDVIVGVVRGGLIPARLLSSFLQVDEMYCLTVKKIEQNRKVATDITEDLSGKDVLLIEDMLETGKSLIEAKKYLESKGAKVKTACLYTRSISEITPDFSLKVIQHEITFPWE